MSLKGYQRRRNFKKTSEPRGKIIKVNKNRFVIQEHWAANHHFDFRMEIDGVLKSWAVPKGLPDKKGVKRLAVQTEDHPLDYINFQGEIPKDQYGAGTVKIFDKGKFELIKKNSNKISFKLKGKKIKGEYHLIKTEFGKKNQWLIIKSK